MADEKPSIDPAMIIEIILIHRWIIMIPVCITMIVGIFLAFTLPKVYRAQTLILVQSQRVPTDFVRSTVSADIDERVSTLSQQIMSRTNLEKIIDKFNLFSGPKQRKMFIEEKIASLRHRITVNVTGSRRRGGAAFSISFLGEDPETVMKITNTLTTFFIDENLKLREAHAKGTSDFLEDNLSKMRERLNEVESEIRTYNQRFLGELPGHLDANLRILEGLQMQLSLRETRLRDVQRQLTILANQEAIARRNRLAGRETSATPAEAGPPVDETLLQLEQLLQNYQSRYTERHPDVIRVKKLIEKHKAEVRRKAEAEPEPPPEIAAPAPAPETPIAQIDGRLNIERLELKNEKADLEAEIAQIFHDTKIYQTRVENTPKRRQELLSIRRDYDNIKAAYNSLLDRKNEAELAVNMERKQKGERFRVLDSAKLPTKPVKPDMKKLFLFSVAAGLGVGGGLTFVREFLNKSFKSPAEIEKVLGLRLLILMPDLHNIWKGRAIKLFKLAMTGVMLMITSGLALVFAFIALKGTEQAISLLTKIQSKL
ncbi:MAG: protein GumC [Desulfobacterales bacterium]|nr:protein GumC [Desulfobacterales bacterium]